LAWGGQFENQQRALATLMVVVPLVLGGIYLLLFLTFGPSKRTQSSSLGCFHQKCGRAYFSLSNTLFTPL
jgi:hypothetical protein